MAPVLAYIERFPLDKFSHPIASRQGPPQIANDRDERKLTENDSHSNLTSFSLKRFFVGTRCMASALTGGCILLQSLPRDQSDLPVSVVQQNIVRQAQRADLRRDHQQQIGRMIWQSVS